MSFLLTKDVNCLIATPVSHLKEVANYLENYKDFFVIEENINKDQLINLCKSNHKIKYLFVNPNAQGYLLDEAVLSQLHLFGINTCSTGTNHIDEDYCSKNNILIKSLKNDFSLINNLPSTSELAFLLMQALLRKLILCQLSVVDKSIWDYRLVMGNQLAGKTIGCLGYGRLGKIFCKQLEGFDVRLKICEKESLQIPKNYEKVSINELFSSCDAVAIHIHSSKLNKNIINKNLLSKTKKGFILINTSRGDLCDEHAISELIKSGHLGGYGTDVLRTEFSNIKDSPIHNIAIQKKYNVIITPHVGGMTFEGQTKAFLHALNKFKFNVK